MAAASAVLSLPLLTTGTAAHAHGAPTSPVSRTFACGPEGNATATAACRAALAASGGPLVDWDYLRIAGVDGRDRSAVPNGRLCSGGLDAFRGLDLPRTDWPTTRMTPGAAFTMRYISTIPHQGTFRLHVTKKGYDPTQPLRWSDLESKPFLTVTNPALKGGAYHLSGTLPADRPGRHVIYTIWENTDTPDTYYSCSDVVFGPAGAAPPAASQPGSGAGSEAGSGVAGGGPGAVTGSGPGAAPTSGPGAATGATPRTKASTGTEAADGAYNASARVPRANDGDESLAARVTPSWTVIIGIMAVTFAAAAGGFLLYVRRRL